jgi:hypothetical protein
VTAPAFAARLRRRDLLLGTIVAALGDAARATVKIIRG